MIAALIQIAIGAGLGLLALAAFVALELSQEFAEWKRRAESGAAEAEAWQRQRARDAR